MAWEMRTGRDFAHGPGCSRGHGNLRMRQAPDPAAMESGIWRRGMPRVPCGGHRGRGSLRRCRALPVPRASLSLHLFGPHDRPTRQGRHRAPGALIACHRARNRHERDGWWSSASKEGIRSPDVFPCLPDAPQPHAIGWCRATARNRAASVRGDGLRVVSAGAFSRYRPTRPFPEDGADGRAGRHAGRWQRADCLCAYL